MSTKTIEGDLTFIEIESVAYNEFAINTIPHIVFKNKNGVCETIFPSKLHISFITVRPSRCKHNVISARNGYVMTVPNKKGNKAWNNNGEYSKLRLSSDLWDPEEDPKFPVYHNIRVIRCGKTCINIRKDLLHTDYSGKVLKEFSEASENKENGFKTEQNKKRLRTYGGASVKEFRPRIIKLNDVDKDFNMNGGSLQICYNFIW